MVAHEHSIFKNLALALNGKGGRFLTLKIGRGCVFAILIQNCVYNYINTGAYVYFQSRLKRDVFNRQKSGKGFKSTCLEMFYSE